MRPTAYVATTSFGNLCLSLRVTVTSRDIAIGLRGIMILRMWPLLFEFATISPTMVMTTYLLLSFSMVGLLVDEFFQNIGLHDGFINSTDLSVLQLHPGPILPSIHEVEQHIFIYEVENMKRDDGELLHICVYASGMLKFPKHALRLIDDIVREESFLELLTEVLPSVDGAKSPPEHGHLRKI